MIIVLIVIIATTEIISTIMIMKNPKYFIVTN